MNAKSSCNKEEEESAFRRGVVSSCGFTTFGAHP